MRILYADDDVDDRVLLREALHHVDPSITCLTVNDGREAINTLRQIVELPDLIFLDVNMPVMDGKECLVRIMNDHTLRMIPIVIYSTTTDATEISQLYDLGASTFIHKPNSFDELCLALTGFIKGLK